MARKTKPTMLEEQRPEPSVEKLIVPLDSIHEDPANANVHDDADITGLMAKLATFGQVEPLVVQASTRKVIGGNGRLHAMRRLGWRECWANLEEVDNVTATAMGIALNTRKSHLDEPTLAKHLRALQSEGFNLVATGYEDADVDRMLARLGDDLAGRVVDDPNAEWEGMPEFQHEDQTSRFQATVHFANETDMRSFEELVGQKIPTNTRAIWHPKAERRVVKGTGYVSDES